MCNTHLKLLPPTVAPCLDVLCAGSTSSGFVSCSVYSWGKYADAALGLAILRFFYCLLELPNQVDVLILPQCRNLNIEINTLKGC